MWHGHQIPLKSLGLVHGEDLDEVFFLRYLAGFQTVFLFFGCQQIFHERAGAGAGNFAEATDDFCEAIQVAGADGMLGFGIPPGDHFRADSQHALNVCY